MRSCRRFHGSVAPAAPSADAGDDRRGTGADVTTPATVATTSAARMTCANCLSFMMTSESEIRAVDVDDQVGCCLGEDAGLPAGTDLHGHGCRDGLTRHV